MLMSICPHLTGYFITLQSAIKYPTFARCRKVAHSGAFVQKVVNSGRIWIMRHTQNGGKRYDGKTLGIRS